MVSCIWSVAKTLYIHIYLSGVYCWRRSKR